jgi:hypothetical protein
MQLPKFTRSHLSKFGKINEKYGHLVELKPAADLKRISEQDIWIRIVSQIVVVGRAAPAQRLKEKKIREILDFKKLSEMTPAKAVKCIGYALAMIGTRMVSKKRPEASPKVIALANNLAFLKKYGGPKKFMRDVAKEQTSQERLLYVENNLIYFGNKGARDFLTTGFGLVTDRIALDVRVMGVVSRIVPGFPIRVQPADYEKTERYLIENICVPLNIEPAHFDQLLFCFQKKIVAHLESSSAVRHSGTLLTKSLRHRCDHLPQLGPRSCLTVG